MGSIDMLDLSGLALVSLVVCALEIFQTVMWWHNESIALQEQIKTLQAQAIQKDASEEKSKMLNKQLMLQSQNDTLKIAYQNASAELKRKDELIQQQSKMLRNKP